MITTYDDVAADLSLSRNYRDELEERAAKRRKITENYIKPKTQRKQKPNQNKVEQLPTNADVEIQSLKSLNELMEMGNEIDETTSPEADQNNRTASPATQENILKTGSEDTLMDVSLSKLPSLQTQPTTESVVSSVSALVVDTDVPSRNFTVESESSKDSRAVLNEMLQKQLDKYNKKQATKEKTFFLIDQLRDRGVDPIMTETVFEEYLEQELRPEIKLPSELEKLQSLYDKLSKTQEDEKVKRELKYKIADIDPELGMETMTDEEWQNYTDSKTKETYVGSAYTEANETMEKRVNQLEKQAQSMQKSDYLQDRLKKAEETVEFLSKPREVREEIIRTQKLQEEARENALKNSIEKDILQRAVEPYVYKRTGNPRYGGFPRTRRSFRAQESPALSVLVPAKQKTEIVTPTLLKPSKTPKPVNIFLSGDTSRLVEALPQSDAVGADFFRYEDDVMVDNFVSAIQPENEFVVTAKNLLGDLQEPFYVVFA